MRNLFLPPTVVFGPEDRTLAAGSPECVVSQDGGELPVRYETTRDGNAFILAVKLNGFWHDPIKAGFSEATIHVWEGDCLTIERDVALQS